METRKWQVNVGFPNKHITGRYGFLITCPRASVEEKIQERMKEYDLFSAGFVAIAQPLDDFGQVAWKAKTLFDLELFPVRVYGGKRYE